jgi:hypothetical protein
MAHSIRHHTPIRATRQQAAAVACEEHLRHRAHVLLTLLQHQLRGGQASVCIHQG